MPRTAKFVRDENISAFRKRLEAETDPAEIERLRALIKREEEMYEASLRAIWSGKRT